MARKKSYWKSERLLSLTAMVLSFVTLIIFIYQTNLMRSQNYLSILPYLQFSVLDDNFENNLALILKNHGVGPAILESVTLEYQGKRYDLSDYDNQLTNFLNFLSPALDSIQYHSFGSLDRGIAIPANSSYVILRVNNSAEDYDILSAQLKKLLEGGLRYEIVYKSLQDERWTIHNDSQGPVKLD